MGQDLIKYVLKCLKYSHLNAKINKNKQVGRGLTKERKFNKKQTNKQLQTHL